MNTPLMKVKSKPELKFVSRPVSRYKIKLAGSAERPRISTGKKQHSKKRK